MLAQPIFNPTLQRMAAFTAFAMAAIYLLMFVMYGAVLAFPQQADFATKVAYLQQHQLLLFVLNGLGYLLFGVLLAVLVQALHNRMQQHHSALLNVATLFGYIWVALVMAAGMLANLGLQKLFNLVDSGFGGAEAFYYSNNLMVSALGGGIELVGGLWLLLLSLVALSQQQLPRLLNYLGIFCGVCGVLTVFHTVTGLTELFGISQILWFIWLGVFLLHDRLVS